MATKGASKNFGQRQAKESVSLLSFVPVGERTGFNNYLYSQFKLWKKERNRCWYHARRFYHQKPGLKTSAIDSLPLPSSPSTSVVVDVAVTPVTDTPSTQPRPKSDPTSGESKRLSLDPPTSKTSPPKVLPLSGKPGKVTSSKESRLPPSPSSSSSYKSRRPGPKPTTSIKPFPIVKPSPTKSSSAPGKPGKEMIKTSTSPKPSPSKSVAATPRPDSNKVIKPASVAPPSRTSLQKLQTDLSFQYSTRRIPFS
eukprot:TRINITY_DN1736_c1_g1_i3.p1 TRINITY_DN1736_c1_g1~~TRINITY_DN1736_c1_g1_i3.p1  ORF type:complete len:253 (+),score=41.61 TRINITY_DN1736_c1_g1_i3:164-922(+)